ncbi:UAA transporter [Panus rudis PR-1116 ss-1]|nr:UAA transporter [Panus rudis PR-1116 ss-1]
MALSLFDLSFALSLVFGGCCSTVWAFEYLLNINPGMGTTLTFSQMLFITLQSLPSQLLWFRPHQSIPLYLPKLKPSQVPLSQWVVQVLVLTTGSLLNNWAFAFHVPLTLQIVFRSAGLAVSMLFGYLFLKKRYTTAQVLSVIIVTAGVILATLSRPSNKSKHEQTLEEYILGVSLLTISLFLTGVLGMLQEKMYTKYGRVWRESVFYTHFLSLPIFLLFTSDIKKGFRSLQSATHRHTPMHPGEPTWSDILSSYAPYLVLAANLVTQLLCVSGVNQLTSMVSSVSTNLVLTIRKALSLCFSVWWFGSGWNAQMGVGASLVFLGSLLYTVASSNNDRKKAQAGVDKKKTQ